MSEKLSVEARAVMDLTSRENATYLDVLHAVLRMEAAAEERGRRAGIEEAAKRCEAMVVVGRAWTEEQAAAADILFTAAEYIRALAPRDSGPLAAPKMQPAPAEQRAAELRRPSPRARVDEPEAPPDSGYSGGCDRNGEGRDGCGRPTCSKCYPVKPDSGEREVEYHCQKCKDFADQVTIPGDLAQRILAALERDIWTELAAELRARMPR